MSRAQYSSRRILAFDFGSKRIGLALWNPEARLGNLLDPLIRTTIKKDIEKLRQCVTSLDVDAFLVGLPLSLGEKITKSTTDALFWADTLKKNFKLDVWTHDESLSTTEALQRLAHLPSQKRSSKKDSASALVVLEDFLRSKGEL